MNTHDEIEMRRADAAGTVDLSEVTLEALIDELIERLNPEQTAELVWELSA